MLSRLIVSVAVIAALSAGVWAFLAFGPSQWSVVTRNSGKVVERSAPFDSANACRSAITQEDQYVNRARAGVVDITVECERTYWGLEKYLPL